jgi:ribose 5-phosphate isomerase RpiB
MAAVRNNEVAAAISLCSGGKGIPVQALRVQGV